MNKKLLAVAVAGALAAPGVALAQSSVTISGFLKMSIQQYKIGSASAARAGTNTSQGLIHDDSSRIIFNVVEDLGGGLSARAQIDWRVNPEAGTDAISGNNHLALASKAWGRVLFGRQDLHYGLRESNLTVKNDLQADSITILAFTENGTAIAGATRTNNVIMYTTPNWGGFYANVAYSFDPTSGFERDLGSATRRGRAWNLQPVFEARNFTVGYSYWSQKADNAGPGSDQRGDRLAGSYRWGGFHIGLAYDKSKVKNGLTGAESQRRTAWSLPIEYSWGPHWVGGHYSKARDDKATADQDGARMWALGYNYSMSKRTSLGLTYASVRNDVGAAYTPFTAGGFNGAAHVALPGEDPRFWSFTMRHSF